MALKVNEASPEVKAMSDSLDKMRALCGGTAAMREAGVTYLPQWPLETTQAYQFRRNTSTLFNATNKTIENLAAKPFNKPITYTEIPKDVEAWFENLDLAGHKLDVFAHKVFYTALRDGLAHILADFPVGSGEVQSKAAEQAAGVRPYAVMLEQSQILGWKTAMVNGYEQLTQLRFMECIEEDDGEWGTKNVDQVRVLEPGIWQKWRKPENSDEWVLFEEGTTTLNYVPLVTCYTRQTGFMTAVPPLEDLADLNIKHWQSSSDQDSLLHTARVPLLVRIGLQDDPVPSAIGKSITDLPLGASMQYVEHSGKAIDAGRQSIADLELQMESMGAELLTVNPGDKTATQSALESAEAQSQLQEMVGRFEDDLDQVITMMGDWVNIPMNGHLNVYRDFAVIPIDGKTFQPFISGLGVLITLGLLSKKSAFAETQRYGLISPDLDWDDEEAQISIEGPALLGAAGGKAPTESITENVRI